MKTVVVKHWIGNNSAFVSLLEAHTCHKTQKDRELGKHIVKGERLPLRLKAGKA